MTHTEALAPETAAKLRQAAAAVETAERDLARARNRLDSAIYDAVVRQGEQVSQVAEVAGVSRPTVYKATGRA